MATGTSSSENQPMMGGSFVEIEHNELERDRMVGKGTYGKVYKATWRGQSVAVKSVETDTEEEVTAFRNELRQLSRVSHKNIVTFLGACTETSNSCLVMEYAENGSLHSFLHETPKVAYTPSHAMNWAKQCAEGVEYLHSMKPKPLVHRDLKPLNLLMFDQGRTLKICDFGTVRDKATLMTKSRGSAAWMAPEVFEDGKLYSEKCDVYSFGIILWEIIFRELPFKHCEWQQIWMKVHVGDRPPVERGCPKSIKDLMSKCWDPSPEKRPAMKVVVEQMRNECGSVPNADADAPLDYTLFVEFEDEVDLANAMKAQPCHSRNVVEPSMKEFPRLWWEHKIKRLKDSNSENGQEGVDDWRVVFNTSRLHIAAQNGREDIVETLLREGADVDEKTEEGRTALYFAVQYGHEAVVEFLLRNGAAVKMRDNLGVTPLHYAAGFGHGSIVRLLLRHEAVINEKNNDEATPLYLAAYSGHEWVVQLLLDEGADVNEKTSNGVTPLFIAASNGHGQVVKILLNKGAEANVTNSTGIAPLHYAAMNGHEDVVEILLDKKVDVDVKYVNGETPLQYAAQNGHVNVVRILLRYQANINMKADNGVTPLHTAILNGYEEIVNILLEEGADPNLPAKDGVKALHIAAGKGHAGIVERLLLEELDINEKTEGGGMTPLYFAVKHGHNGIVNVLRRHGADFTLKDSEGRTPLHFAAKEGHVEIVKNLLNIKEDLLDEKEKNGMTPLHYATLGGHDEVVDILLSNGAAMDERWFWIDNQIRKNSRPAADGHK